MIEPGAVGALVSNIATDVVFPASDKVTHNNTILRTGGTIMVQGGTLEDNLLVDSLAVNIDVTTSGYLRNNRFIRAPGQMQGNHMLKFLGSPERPSTGNVFLWMNAGGNDGPTTEIDGITDLTIAVVDVEMWSQNSKPTAVFVTGPIQRLNLFAIQGGRYDKDLERRKQFGLVDSGAREVRAFGLTAAYRVQAPDTLPAKVVLRKGNERSLFVDSLAYSFSLPSPGTLQMRASERVIGLPPSKPCQAFVVTPKGAETWQRVALQGMIAQTARVMQPWDRPIFGPVPNPAGENWEKDITGARDDTQKLQDRLDKEGMVVLEPGKYYISAPLRINRDKGLIGAGMDKTVIIAKNSGLSMFVYDPEGNTPSVSLANLTLQGGRVGVHFRCEDMKQYINRSFLSHITFREMTEAGVYVDLPGNGAPSPNNNPPEHNQSMDNNLISFCNFVKCATGIKQARSLSHSPHGFIDKLVMYRCQFLQCGIGIDFPAMRNNNACAYIECRFAGNTTTAVRLEHNTTPAFANCDFVGNAGNPVVASDGTVNFLSCLFQDNAGAKSLLPSETISEGCVFKPGTSPEAVVVKNPAQNNFYNCRVEMPLGPLKEALFLNNQVKGRPALSQMAAQILKGVETILIPGETKPGPQFLVKEIGTDKTK